LHARLDVGDSAKIGYLAALSGRPAHEEGGNRFSVEIGKSLYPRPRHGLFAALQREVTLFGAFPLFLLQTKDVRHLQRANARIFTCPSKYIRVDVRFVSHAPFGYPFVLRDPIRASRTTLPSRVPRGKSLLPIKSC
jgi:hypothetical protein